MRENALSCDVFIYCLFHDAIIISDCIALSGQIINELESMWREAVMIEFEVLSQHLLGETEKNHENLQSG
jgi:hypothetical protein